MMCLINVPERPNVLPFKDCVFLQTYKWLYATDDLKLVSIKERCVPWWHEIEIMEVT